jgi:hypothetical protein
MLLHKVVHSGIDFDFEILGLSIIVPLYAADRPIRYVKLSIHQYINQSLHGIDFGTNLSQCVLSPKQAKLRLRFK